MAIVITTELGCGHCRAVFEMLGAPPRPEDAPRCPDCDTVLEVVEFATPAKEPADD